jgi:EAL and modified HD-GYP domain-containing signal transduction protein
MAGHLRLKSLPPAPMKSMGEWMAAAIQLVFKTEDQGSKSANRLCSVVRQPILDLHSRVHAYQLLFRGWPDVDEAAGYNNLRETALAFRLEKPSELKKLTGKLTAFVRCPAETLNEQLAQMLPASLTVLEIGPFAEVSSELITTCRELKALGFRIALHDFNADPQTRSLLEVADYVNVDFVRIPPELRRKISNEFRDKTTVMLAKGINTRADFRQAREEGFTLFEGFYFCELVAMKNRRPPVNQMLRLDILKALQQHPLDMHKVSQLVRRDGPLTYQLLRLVNSPVWGMRQNVESIEVALVAVGENAFRRIATLAIASEFNGDQPAELLCMAMLRGRICEVTAPNRGVDPFGQYLLGLLSMLPAMQGQPMSEVAPTLPLADEIREALLGKRNCERAMLSWLENFERGDWAGCDAAAEAVELDQQALARVYVDAVAWTEKALHSGA